jgi:hypothetical protein
MRRIEADIDGSETERRVFASFRAAIPDGAAARLCGFTSFWRRLSPSAGCQDKAIKHAVVALAVAYQQFHYPNQPIIHGFGPGDLEIFTIQQYNQSIESLQSHAGSSAAESIRVTLVCCLIFISLEMLRGNHSVAVTHITNGLRILQSLPDSAFDCLADRSTFVWPSNRDSLDMPDIIQIFARLELSACFFTYGIQPVISERGYRTRRFDDGSSDGPFTDMPQARLAMSCFQHDAMARLHEIATITAAGDEPIAMFWCDPIQQQQQTCLLARSTRLGALIAEFFSPARFGAPDPATPELFSLYLDLLYFHCAQFLISRITTNTTNPNPTPTLLPTILNLATRLATTPSTPTPPPPLAPPQPPTAPPPPARPPRTLTDMHTRLLGPLFLVATHTPPSSNDDDGTDTQAAAVRLLAECMWRYDYHYHDQPGIDDDGAGGGSSGRAVRRAVGVVERAVLQAQVQVRRREGWGWLATEAPRALTGVGGVPVLWDVMR